VAKWLENGAQQIMSKTSGMKNIENNGEKIESESVIMAAKWREKR
jgi:hypothetical protein